MPTKGHYGCHTCNGSRPPQPFVLSLQHGGEEGNRTPRTVTPNILAKCHDSPMFVASPKDFTLRARTAFCGPSEKHISYHTPIEGCVKPLGSPGRFTSSQYLKRSCQRGFDKVH